MGKFYAFTGETKKYRGRILRRIVKLNGGLIGGWIESEDNLPNKESNENAFVYGDSMVFGNSKIINSQIYDHAIIFNSTILDSIVRSRSCIQDSSVFFSKVINSKVLGDSMVEYGCIKNNVSLTNTAVCNSTIEEDNILKDSKLDGVESFNACVYDGIYTRCPSVFKHFTIQSPAPSGSRRKVRPMTCFVDNKQIIRINIGCQRELTLKQLKEQIFDLDMGPAFEIQHSNIQSNKYLRHRQAYLDQIEMIEKLLK